MEEEFLSRIVEEEVLRLESSRRRVDAAAPSSKKREKESLSPGPLPPELVATEAMGRRARFIYGVARFDYGGVRFDRGGADLAAASPDSAVAASNRKLDGAVRGEVIDVGGRGEGSGGARAVRQLGKPARGW